VTLVIAKFNGLWSVRIWNLDSSRRKRKCLTAVCEIADLGKEGMKMPGPVFQAVAGLFKHVSQKHPPPAGG
jgi:hypothetical protein